MCWSLNGAEYLHGASGDSEWYGENFSWGEGQGAQETRGVDQNCQRAHQGRPLETVAFAPERGAAGEGNHDKIHGKSIPGREEKQVQGHVVSSCLECLRNSKQQVVDYYNYYLRIFRHPIRQFQLAKEEMEFQKSDLIHSR